MADKTIDEGQIGMPESTAYALLAYKEARRAQLWFYVAGFFSGITFTLVVLKLFGAW